MRTTININKNWGFLKDSTTIPSSFPTDWETVNLPHTWNAIDGMDGGADYFRGTCLYAKVIEKNELPANNRYYIEINGANSSSDIYMNGTHLMHHDGGYSTWRCELTPCLMEENLLVIAVDNTPNDKVYPQVADFTFYGGLYRDVNLVCVGDSHFELITDENDSVNTLGGYISGKESICSSNGMFITPTIQNPDPSSNSSNLPSKTAIVNIKTSVTNPKPGQLFHYEIKDADGTVVAETTTDTPEAVLTIEHVHLWHGRKDPYLYSAAAQLLENNTVIDQISSSFGCRTFKIDPEKGFLLNGEEYPLRGVSRHQDRIGFGNALLPEHHEEDMDLICEVGANTIRLAHYQHDQYFYDLCDRKGMVVWAEIPYISNHMPTGRDNTISQMKELITQNYNHPSIVVWGLSNEITINGENPDLYENHVLLNDLAHKLDPTRPTTLAIVSMCSMDAKYIQIPDTVAWNHYWGWYGGDVSMNGPWFDKFHAKYPHIPVGCSEYGCEALNWHNSNPKQGDYSEEYQAYYHEELIKQLFPRKYIWSTYVWNMFDFGADARGEGGENGQNHKGLVTIDRKYKKDAFYAYKAWLSDEPFVHICGKRYVDRVEDVTKVTVYSNLKTVELFANGESLGAKEAADHFFYFDVPNVGETKLVAVAQEYKDESFIRKVDTFNEAYRLVEQGAVLNWFDITEREGYCSLNTTINDILGTFRGKLFIASMAKQVMKQLKSKKESGKNSSGFTLSKDMMKMIGSFTILRISSMAGMVGLEFTKEELLEMNRKLNKIRLPRR